MTGRQFGRRIFRLPLFRADTQDVDDEIEFHLATRAAEFVRRGMSPADADAEAHRRFGISRDTDLATIKAGLHRSAHHREEQMKMRDRLDNLLRDARYAFRGIRQKPGLSIAIILTLALGIGATTAIYSVVQAVILRPLPYANPNQVAMVWTHWTNWPRTWLSEPEAHDYAAQTQIFQAFGAFNSGAMNVTSGDGDPERLPIGLVQAGFFDAVGVRPIIGRTFTKDEDVPNGPGLVMLTEELWRRRFAEDRAIIGKRIEMNGSPKEVIGVLPADFRMPTQFAGTHAEAFVPMQLAPPSENDRGSHYLNAVARLRPGLTPAQAENRLTAFVEQYKKEHPTDYGPEFGIEVRPVADQVRGDIRPILLVLLGVVSFVLLIACANVANLQLSRAEARSREIAVRAAMGASNGRIASQLFVENIVLAIVGGAFGLALAAFLLRVITHANLANLPRVDSIAMNGGVLLFAMGVSITTGLLFGLAPVLHTLGNRSTLLLRQGRGNTSGRSVFRVRALLISAEVALAVVAIAGALLMARSFDRLVSVPPGFTPENALTFRLSAPVAKYKESVRVRGLYDRVLAAVRAVPGVSVAGGVTALPLATELGDWGVDVEGIPRAPLGTPSPAIDWMSATPGYLEAMKTPILRGRTILESDRLGAEPVVVINEATVRKYFPNRDPLGLHIRLGGIADSVQRRIVGVAKDVRHSGLDKDVRPQMWIPYGQFASTLPDSAGAIPRAITIVARTPASPTSITSAVRNAIRAIDPTLPIADVRTLEDVFDRSVSTPRIVAQLLGAFGALALLLSAIGVYGVTSYAVARRTNEIGIRVALGARVRDVVRLITWQGMRPALLGAVVGVVLAFAGTRLMEKFLYGISATDAVSLSAAPIILLLVGVMANWIPARRASSVDPVTALRAD